MLSRLLAIGCNRVSVTACLGASVLPTTLTRTVNTTARTVTSSIRGVYKTNITASNRLHRCMPKCQIRSCHATTTVNHTNPQQTHPLPRRERWYNNNLARYVAVGTAVGLTAGASVAILSKYLSSEDELQANYTTPVAYSDDMYHAPAEPQAGFFKRRAIEIQLLGRIAKLAAIFFPVVLTLPLTLISYFRPLWWSLLRWALESAGGCWIKLGQWASTRPDLFPEDLIHTVENLQDQCPAHSIADTREIIRKSFNAEIEEIFEEFSLEPIASGAIAQVHKAKLKVDGTPVAVKILHPNIENIVALDLKIMTIGARLISYLPTTEYLSLPEAIQEFSSRMILQTDLRGEAHNLRVFNRNFKNDKHVVFPRPIEDLCSRHCLVETFEHGIPLHTYLKQKASDKSALPHRKRLARIGLNAYLKMMLTDNFVHADLHPGNILVRITNDKQQIVLLDVGLVSQLTERDWTNFKDLFRCIVEGNGKAGAELMSTRARHTSLRPEEKAKFLHEMDVLFSTIRNQKLSEINVGLFLSNLLAVVRRYRVKIEPNFATLCVATVVLEGIGRQLDPDINIVDQSVPFLLKSGKATMRDMSVFVREKAKDELYEHDHIKIPERQWFWKMWEFTKQLLTE